MPALGSRKKKAVGAAAVAAAAVGVATVGGRVLLRRTAATIRSRGDADLDPLLDMPAGVVHHVVPADDGGSLHVVEGGEGPVLFLIHGVTLQASVWSPMFHLLADRYRVVAMDVRGHGRSVAGADGYGRRPAARDVVSVLEHLDLREVVVVGHSMGGMIAMEFAGEFPSVLADRVIGLVFMNTAAYQVLPRPVLPVAKFLGRHMISRVGTGKAVPSFAAGDLSLVTARVAFGRDPSAKAVEQVRRFLEEIPQEASLPSSIDLLDHDARETLSATKTPSLVMVGSMDLLTPVFAARRIARFLPDARFEVLDGAGHQLMQERPRQVAALLDEFASYCRGG